MSRPLCFLIVGLLCPMEKSEAQLYADVETTLGTFTIDLDYTNTPITVGNFVGLATGELPWIDPDSGQVKLDTPYYDGIIFHRVIAGFMNQGGDPTGTGSGGPGYQFTDELSTSDFSSPYQVAMANSGPQTNGSQFFVTVPPAVSPPTHLNGVHTVFGFVPEDDGPDGIVDGSRSVIDAINAVATDGNNRPETPVEILSVTIRRTDAAAQAFTIPAADLPAVAPVEVDFNRTESGMELGFNQTPGSTFQIGVSGDLSTWVTETRYISSDESALTSYAPAIQGADASKQFYKPVQVTSPNAVTFPNSMANRVLTAEVGTSATNEFVFNADGSGGTYAYTPTGASEPTITGTFSIYSTIPYSADADGGRLILDLTNINASIWAFNRLGMDSWDGTNINGRHNLTYYFNSGGSSSQPGTFSLSR